MNRAVPHCPALCKQQAGLELALGQEEGGEAELLNCCTMARMVWDTWDDIFWWRGPRSGGGRQAVTDGKGVLIMRTLKMPGSEFEHDLKSLSEGFEKAGR